MQKAWADWVEFRKQKKKPLTKLAAEKSILMLHTAFTDGYCPVAVIEKSIINGWQGLVPPKEGDKKIYRPEKRGFVC